jgi:hypothetical protein
MLLHEYCRKSWLSKKMKRNHYHNCFNSNDFKNKMLSFIYNLFMSIPMVLFKVKFWKFYVLLKN